MKVNDRVLIADKTGKPMQDEDSTLVFRVAGVLQEDTLEVYWLWLEADDEYDGYDGTCVVQRLVGPPDLIVGDYVLLLADERSSIPRALTLLPV